MKSNSSLGAVLTVYSPFAATNVYHGTSCWEEDAISYLGRWLVRVGSIGRSTTQLDTLHHRPSCAYRVCRWEDRIARLHRAATRGGVAAALCVLLNNRRIPRGERREINSPRQRRITRAGLGSCHMAASSKLCPARRPNGGVRLITGPLLHMTPKSLEYRIRVHTTAAVRLCNDPWLTTFHLIS